MIMITGGAFSGKLDFAREQFGLKEDEIADGTDCALEEVFAAKCIVHYERLIRRLMEMDGQELRSGAGDADEKAVVEPAGTARGDSLCPLAFTDRLLAENPAAIVIMDEIGGGIIPLEKSERLWREQTGLAGCRIAQQSDTVIRVCCGIPEVIHER